ncbi:MAG TPA: hypothetical protein VFI65_05300 [Streptosporangiaceae bacterium]|nr:hypothetical protein [Streptosporangiaceae bacterium]
MLLSRSKIANIEASCGARVVNVFEPTYVDMNSPNVVTADLLNPTGERAGRFGGQRAAKPNKVNPLGGGALRD